MLHGYLGHFQVIVRQAGLECWSLLSDPEKIYSVSSSQGACDVVIFWHSCIICSLISFFEKSFNCIYLFCVCALVHMWRSKGNLVLSWFSSSAMWTSWLDSGHWFGSNLCFWFFETVFYSIAQAGLTWTHSLQEMTLNLWSPLPHLWDCRHEPHLVLCGVGI